MIRIGMLSFWHLHGKDYAKASQDNPNTQIVAIWDEDATRGAEEAERYGADFHADLNELLARDDIDAVVVDSPTNIHRDVIIAAARAGKHIFTEKVIAATQRETEEIIREVDAAGVAFVTSMWRSDEAYATAIKEIIDRGVLGEITELRIRDGHPMGLPSKEFPNGFLPPHFWSATEAQGGALIDLCHPVYLVSQFLGLPSTVSAALGFHTGHEVEDNAVVTMTYPSGAVAIAETSYISAFTPFSIEAHGTLGSLVFSIDGIGEMVARHRDPEVAAAGAASTTGPTGLLRVRSAQLSDQWEEIELPSGEWPKAFEKWVSHIEAGSTAPQNVALASTLSSIIEAAYLSHSTRAFVDIATLEHAS